MRIHQAGGSARFVLGKGDTHGRTELRKSSLHESIELVGQRVDQLSPQAGPLGLRSAPVVAHVANDTPVRLADHDRNPTPPWVESMTTSIVYELRDEKVRMPASPGTQHDGAIECQKQIDFPIADEGSYASSL
jgi:hypothetical protein